MTDTPSNYSTLNYPIQTGVYAGWCVDKGVTMIRNEAHNVVLYSTINSTLSNNIRPYKWNAVNYILNHKQGSMQEIQNAIWYFVPDFITPPLNETNTWNMINEAKANPKYVPSKGEIMAIIAFTGSTPGVYPYGNSGVQNTILEYKIP